MRFGAVDCGGCGTGRIRDGAQFCDACGAPTTTTYESAEHKPGFVLHEIPLLRLRALLARQDGDQTGYLDWADRYRATATACGFQGHMAMAEEMR